MITRESTGFVLIICILLLLTSCKRNDELTMQPYEGYPLLESRKEINEFLGAKCVDTIQFQKGEVIADIGAGNGYIEAMLSVFHDSITFYVQDIDSAVCNQLAVNRLINYYEEVRGTPFTCKIIAVIGNDTASCLPEVEFDRILMLWTYQYLKYPGPFISDLRKKLKAEGQLYVINPDQDYKYGLELQKKKGWNGSTVEKQISDIIACGFVLTHFTRNYQDNEQAFMMVFRKCG